MEATTTTTAATFGADDAYAWGLHVGQEVREGTRPSLGTDWRDGYGRPIAWETSDGPFPRGYRDGLAGVTR